MKLSRLLSVLLLMGCTALAWAHAHLVKSDPADGSTVTAAPQKFVLTFAEPAKLTALSVQKDAEPAKKVGPLPAALAAEITVPAPELAPGKYVLMWRAVGDDGHIMPGKVIFTVGH
jgi:methionine-rich copper-binding protein CopC